MSTGQLFFDSSHFSAINAVTDNDKSFEFDNTIPVASNFGINNLNGGKHSLSNYKPISWDIYYGTEFNESKFTIFIIKYW